MPYFDIEQMSQSERLALVLAGLRSLQGEMDDGRINGWSESLLLDEGIEGLTANDIDAICEAINTTGFNLSVDNGLDMIDKSIDPSTSFSP